MEPVNDMGNLWPTATQVLLLQASLMKGENAVESWEKWKASTDLRDVDAGSQRLFPLVYSNLVSQGLRDPVLSEFKETWLGTWYENRMMLQQLADLLRLFHGAGIRTLVLKGAALTVLYYEDYGVRPMCDVDVLIPTDKAAVALKLLKRSGWTAESNPSAPERLIPVRHSLGFKGPTGLNVDVHWHLLLECNQADADLYFWQDPNAIQIDGVTSFALNATCQLLHICAHGAAWSKVPPLRWIADAVTVMRKSPVEIKWKSLVHLAQTRSLVLPLRKTLKYLRANFDAPVPVFVIDQLEALPVSRLERIGAKVKTRPPDDIHPLLSFCYNYHLFLRSSNPSGFHDTFVGFTNYLKHFWALDRLSQVPLHAIGKGLKRAWSKMVYQRAQRRSLDRHA
ncbi:MAG: nucleotidyltransferase family protein [Deltaproteobacteria bacterium]|nr:nucleotidyltransferase family protein [Deltaproteobacteria bacterium]